MKITLHNIGKIGEATIELNGITVIAGENDTGKSTVGKALYSVFNSLYRINEQIDRERSDSIEENLDICPTHLFDSINKLGIKKTTENTKINLHNYESLRKEFEDLLTEVKENSGGKINKKECEEAIKRIIEVLQVSDDAIFTAILVKKLKSEFDRQITNIYFPDKEGHIELTIKDMQIKISLLDNRITNIPNKINLHTEVIYIEDPFILDEGKTFLELAFLYDYSNSNHRNHLHFKLFKFKMESTVIGEIIISKKLESILSKINTVCSGEMVNTSHNSFGYKKNAGEPILDIKNLSTGLKTFVILKTLLLKGALQQNGTIVLDEPEIHLHPKWQLVFAELIVLIQKEFGLHILINTHSPYFLRAIEVYSAEHETADKCKYYLSAIENEIATFEDVTIHTDKIYKKLATPLENLQINRYSDD